MDRHIVEEYRADGGLLLDAIQGLNPIQMNTRPVADTWTIQEIVIHMFDSELIAVHRLRRLIAEQNPLLIGYDESAFARSLFYEKTDPVLAASMVKNLREMMADTLNLCSPEAFEKVGVHSETGRIQVADYLKKNVEHLRHHMKFLNEKKKMVQR